jgi:TRAP-type C4-dicarboxylate transport system permease small subunit
MIMVRKLISWLDVNFEPILVTVLFVSMIILVSGQVILRFVFRTGFSWAEEMSRYMFVWLVYFCLSYATRNNRHIRLTFIVGLFAEGAQKLIALFTDMLFLVFSLFLLVSCWRIVESTARFGDMAITLNISRNILYGSGLVGFILNTIRLVQVMAWKIRMRNAPLQTFLVYHSNRTETMAFGTLQTMQDTLRAHQKAGLQEVGK